MVEMPEYVLRTRVDEDGVLDQQSSQRGPRYQGSTYRDVMMVLGSLTQDFDKTARFLKGWLAAHKFTSIKRCYYCGDHQHISVTCDKYTSIDSRLAVLRDAGRCTLCLTGNHDPANCTKKRNACLCSFPVHLHHHSLCPNKFPQKDGDKVPTGPVPNQESMLTLISQSAQAPQADHEIYPSCTIG